MYYLLVSESSQSRIDLAEQFWLRVSREVSVKPWPGPTSSASVTVDRGPTCKQMAHAHGCGQKASVPRHTGPSEHPHSRAAGFPKRETQEEELGGSPGAFDDLVSAVTHHHFCSSSHEFVRPLTEPSPHKGDRVWLPLYFFFSS